MELPAPGWRIKYYVLLAHIQDGPHSCSPFDPEKTARLRQLFDAHARPDGSGVVTEQGLERILAGFESWWRALGDVVDICNGVTACAEGVVQPPHAAAGDGGDRRVGDDDASAAGTAAATARAARAAANLEDPADAPPITKSHAMTTKLWQRDPSDDGVVEPDRLTRVLIDEVRPARANRATATIAHVRSGAPRDSIDEDGL